MPGIEVLPNSTSIKSPGWALVPDTRGGAAQVVAQPTGGRKRAARNVGLASGDTTARQQNAVIKHLADLDRDSHRDIQIPVPKDGAGRGSKKTTPNVRRILMSQKTFANHLADEEAALAQQHHIGSSTAVPRAQGAKLVPNLKRSATSETNSTTKGPVATLAPRDPLDDEPLLKSYVPTAPSGEEMEALLSGPPLSYNAARTAPPPSGMPQRQFCEICGYWGTIKCVKCGARVCGLECKIGHDDSRCLKFYT